MTLRLDGLLDERVSELARERGITRSEVVRDALERVVLKEKRGKALTAYDRMKPWIGSVDSSKYVKGPVTSDDASAQARAIIVEKWEKRGAKRTR